MYVSRSEQLTLACNLFDHCVIHLDPLRCSRLTTQIGAGDLEHALIALLGCCTRNSIQLPVEVAVSLRGWVEGYAGTDVAANFAFYIDGLPAGVTEVPPDKAISPDGRMWGGTDRHPMRRRWTAIIR